MYADSDTYNGVQQCAAVNWGEYFKLKLKFRIKLYRGIFLL